MNTRSMPWLGACALVSLFSLNHAMAEEQAAAKPNQESSAPMGGMQHSMGGMGAAQDSMAGMQAGQGGMQHGGMGSGMQGQGGMMGEMGAMTELQQEELWKQVQAQDIRLGELRRQMREANDQGLREKLRVEHRSVLKQQLVATHKLMMHEHMKTMKGPSMSSSQPAAHP